MALGMSSLDDALGRARRTRRHGRGERPVNSSRRLRLKGVSRGSEARVLPHRQGSASITLELLRRARFSREPEVSDGTERAGSASVGPRP